MDSLTTVPSTWVEFAFVVWKDVWGYMATAGVGLVVGALLPQLRVKPSNLLKKASKQG